MDYLSLWKAALFDKGTIVAVLAVYGGIRTVLSFISGLHKSLRWIEHRFFGRRDPEWKLERRRKWKAELAEKLPARDQYGTRGEAILRDVARMEDYPQVTHSLFYGSSALKVEVKGVYDEGLEVFFSMGQRIIKNASGQWVRDDKAPKEKSTFVLPVGRIPGEFIEDIDWEFDAVEGLPQVFCHFRGLNRSPFKEVAWVRRSEFSDGGPMHLIVPDYKPKLPGFFSGLYRSLTYKWDRFWSGREEKRWRTKSR